MRSRFDGLEMFCAVAEAGGFGAAARRLGVSTGAVSQAVRALEQRHGVLLLRRTTRQVSLTDAGARLHARLKPALEEVDAALAGLAGDDAAPRGLLRLTVPCAVVPLLVAPLLPRLRARHPLLSLEVSVSDLPVDLIASGFDAGIRLGDAVERDMVAVPLTPPLDWVLVAAPAYLARAGTPDSVEALATHEAVAFRFPGSRQIDAWEFERDGRRVRVSPPAPVCVDDRDLLLAAVHAGLGLAVLDRITVAGDLASGRLVSVLDGQVPGTPGLSLYFPQRSQSQPRLRALIDTLREVAAELPTSPAG